MHSSSRSRGWTVHVAKAKTGYTEVPDEGDGGDGSDRGNSGHDASRDADLIIIDGDPLADIALLADPARVLGVWKAGHRVKGSNEA